MKKFTIAILVNNQFGVLNRVTSMFRRRQFNISSLTVSETESEKFSRITVQSEGDEVKKEQLINQLYKLPDVVSIAELDNLDTVNRELLLIKVRNDSNFRGDISAASEPSPEIEPTVLMLPVATFPITVFANPPPLFTEEV